MNKETLLGALRNIKAEVENTKNWDELDGYGRIQVIDKLLDYIGDNAIREAVEEIPL